MPSLGISEVLIIMFLLLVVYAIPIAVAVWVVITLTHIKTGQKIIQSRLEEIEHAVRQGQSGSQPV